MKTFWAKEGSGIRLITHQSSCEFSAAVGHRRERERTEDNSGREGICWAALKAPYFPFPSLSTSLSLLLSLARSALSSPTAAGCFLGKAEQRKISLSLSHVQPFLSPPLTLSLSLLPSCALSVTHPSSPYIFFRLSYFLCSLYLSLTGCEFGCACACLNGFNLSRRQNQIRTKMWISYACIC